jgi:hypothetical protein
LLPAAAPGHAPATAESMQQAPAHGCLQPVPLLGCQGRLSTAPHQTCCGAGAWSGGSTTTAAAAPTPCLSCSAQAGAGCAWKPWNVIGKVFSRRNKQSDVFVSQRVGKDLNPGGERACACTCPERGSLHKKAARATRLLARSPPECCPPRPIKSAGAAYKRQTTVGFPSLCLALHSSCKHGPCKLLPRGRLRRGGVPVCLW